MLSPWRSYPEKLASCCWPAARRHASGSVRSRWLRTAFPLGLAPIGWPTPLANGSRRVLGDFRCCASLRFQHGLGIRLKRPAHRLQVEPGVNGSGRRLGVVEHPPDHRQPVPARGQPTAEGPAQIMNADVLRLRALLDALPGLLGLLEMARARRRRREHPFGVAAARQRLEDLDGGRRQRQEVRTSRLGHRQSPSPRREVQLGPLRAKELMPSRPQQQRETEICAPPPVGLFIDGEQRSAELVRIQEAIASLFAELRGCPWPGCRLRQSPQMRARLNIARSRASPRFAA